MRTQQLTPERGPNVGLDGGDDDLTLAKAVEHLHQEVIGLRRVAATRALGPVRPPIAKGPATGLVGERVAHAC